jgi:hypothetical protein
MERLPTIKVVHEGESGWMLINEADFDAAKYQLWVEPPAELSAAELPAPEPEKKKRAKKPETLPPKPVETLSPSAPKPAQTEGVDDETDETDESDE